jgi:hypothetical protein
MLALIALIVNYILVLQGLQIISQEVYCLQHLNLRELTGQPILILSLPFPCSIYCHH